MVLSGTGNIDRVGRYGGARIYIPSKIAFDSALPFKMGEEIKISISPETKTLLVVPADDKRDLMVIESTKMKVIMSLLRELYAKNQGKSSRNRPEITAAEVEQRLEELVRA